MWLSGKQDHYRRMAGGWQEDAQRKTEARVAGSQCGRDTGWSGTKKRAAVWRCGRNPICSSINWAPVTQKGYWQIRLDAVKVQGALSFCYRSTKGCQAIVDTGTSLISGPAREVLLLQQFIGATPTAVGEYLIDCVRISSLPVVSFLINNVEYSLTGEQYIRRETLNNKEICFSGFQSIDIPSPAGSVWILGDVFLSQFYSIYDRGHNQVGLSDNQAHLSGRSQISV
ncbi:hypothetical protein QQF64_036317 [Cirrhinus molitorella]|uniref:Peptidase A1 domain-containing protein n=1 Tax=Cirrhinus molitorella TaxID=172907 RepID=A0ABR3NIF8_9TELE